MARRRATAQRISVRAEELGEACKGDDARGDERGRGVWCMEEPNTKECGKEER